MPICHDVGACSSPVSYITQHHLITGITINHQLIFADCGAQAAGGIAAVEHVGVVKTLQHIGQAQLQGVVAAAGQVDFLDVLNGGAAQQAQVQQDARAVELEGVDAVTAVDAGNGWRRATLAQLGDVVGVGHDQVVASAAVQHV
jgi:hypothetical protein